MARPSARAIIDRVCTLISGRALLSTVVLASLLLLGYPGLLSDRALYSISGPAEGLSWPVAQYQMALDTLRQHVYERALLHEPQERHQAEAQVGRSRDVLDTQLDALANVDERKRFFEELAAYRHALPLLQGLQRDLPSLLDRARDSHDGLLQFKARLDELDDPLASLASAVHRRDLDAQTDALHQSRRGQRLQYLAASATILALWLLLLVNGDRVRRAREALDALTRAGDETRQTLQARTALIGILPHELRTPLQAVRAAAELIEGADHEGRFKRTLERLYLALHTVDRHIGDIARYAELSRSAPIASEPLDLRMLLGELVTEHGAAARAKGLELLLEIDAAVPQLLALDAVRFGQIAGNLMGNAIKYTAAGSVRVRASSNGTAGAPRYLTLEVRDTGPGIAAEEQDKVWEPFYRGRQARQQPGTGLGLAVVRLAIESLGGKITLHSRPAQGATFVVEVPVSDRHP
jgi:signal transduction histidine kinase